MENLILLFHFLRLTLTYYTIFILTRGFSFHFSFCVGFYARSSSFYYCKSLLLTTKFFLAVSRVSSSNPARNLDWKIFLKNLRQP